jgi:hypothetical protein
MNQSIQNGTRQGGVTDHVMPFLNGELAGGDGGTTAVPLLQHCQQVSPVLSTQFHEPPAIQDQHIHFGEVGQDLSR